MIGTVIIIYINNNVMKYIISMVFSIRVKNVLYFSFSCCHAHDNNKVFFFF